MNKDSRMRMRYFLLSFTVAFFVISALFFFLVSVVHPRASVVPEPVATLDEPEEPFRPGREDALTVLFLGTQTKQSVPGVSLLAHFAPEQGTVFLTVLPPETLLNNGGTLQPMSQVYAYGGAAYTRDCLADTLSMEVDRYVRMDVESFITAAAAVGTVEYRLPRQMEVVQDGYAFTLEPGVQLLDGRRISQILSWNGYADEYERIQMAESLIAAVVDQRRDIAASTVVDRVFERIINLIDTDISYADYAVRKAAGEYLARLEGPVAEIIPVGGQEEENGFRLSDTFTARLAQAYS